MHTEVGGLIPAHSSTELKGSSLIGTPRSLPVEDGYKASSTIRTQRGLKVDCSGFTGQRPPNTQQSVCSDCEWSPTGSNLMRRSGYGRGIPRGNASKSAVVRTIPLSHPKTCDVTDGYSISFEDALSSVCSVPSGISIYVLLKLQTRLTAVKIFYSIAEKVLSWKDKVQPLSKVLERRKKKSDPETGSENCSIYFSKENIEAKKTPRTIDLFDDRFTSLAWFKEEGGKIERKTPVGQERVVRRNLYRMRSANKGIRNQAPCRSHSSTSRENGLWAGRAVEPANPHGIGEFKEKQQVRPELYTGVDH